jgi:hypothetical protein
MRGVITSRDIVLHGPTILREFGLRVLMRCLAGVLRRRRCTFIEVVFALDTQPITAAVRTTQA